MEQEYHQREQLLLSREDIVGQEPEPNRKEVLKLLRNGIENTENQGIKKKYYITPSP